jgi:hypothetical protein
MMDLGIDALESRVVWFSAWCAFHGWGWRTFAAVI